ncbi:MAG: c-type cytochrome [Pirellulales bacterium]
MPDKDGDDVPDGPPQVVLTGWSTVGKHNVVNSLQWGPDGWLYGCNGITSPSRVGTPDTPEDKRVRMECGVWRYHPTRKTFEVVMHGGTNPFGLDWNAEGEAFVTNCVIGHLFHVIPGAHYQRMFGQDLNPYAYELMPPTSEHLHWAGGDWTKARGGASNDALGGGHAHSGAIFMLGEQWPKEMRGDLLMCNIHGNRINRDHIDKTSTGYVGRYRPDLIKFNDDWFRGVAFAAAPDGSIYVTDWCDVGECHDYKEVHRNSGRIYKFWHGDLKKWKPEDLQALKIDPHKVEAAKDAWSARRVVQSAFENSDARSPILDPLLKQYQSLLKQTDRKDQDDIQLSYTIGVLHGLRPDVHLVDAAFGMVFQNTLPNASDMIQKRFFAMGGDRTDATEKPNYFQHGSVALKNIESGTLVTTLLSELRNLPVSSRKSALSNALQNKVFRATAPVKEDNYGEWAARRNLQCMTWLAMEPVVAADPVWAAEQVETCPDPLLVKLILRRLCDVKDPAALAANLKPLFVRESLWKDDARTYDLLAALQSGLAGQKSIPLPEGWTALAATLGKHPDGRVRNQVLELGYLFGDPAIATTLLATLDDAKKSVGEREKAIKLLALKKNADLGERLGKLLDEPALRGATIRVLGVYNRPETSTWLLERFAKLTPDEKQAAVETLAGRKEGASALLTALAEKKLDRADIPSYVARQIELLKDKDLSKRLRDQWGMVRTGGEAVEKKKQTLKTALTDERLAAADVGHGEALFKTNCRSCHTLFGPGGNVGPDLNGAQRGNLDYLLDNILDPSALVARDYRLSVLTLNDGRVVSGVEVEESAAGVKLRTLDGDRVISKDDIDEKTTTNQSMMPEGLLDKLTPDEVRDLLGYVQGKK